MRLHVHLISDSTGETVTTVARAAVSQFEDVVPVEHVWFFIRTRQQLEKVLAIVEVLPGLVIFTLASPELRKSFEAMSFDVGSGSTEELAALIARGRERYGRIVSERKITVN